MAAFMQKLCDHISLIRQGPQADHYGDPYEWCVTVIHLSSSKVELVGIDKPMTAAIWRDVMNCCEAVGIEHLVWERILGEEDKRIKLFPVRRMS